MSSKCTACLAANCVNRKLLLAGSTINKVIWAVRGRKLKPAAWPARKQGLSWGCAIRKGDNIGFKWDKGRSNTLTQDKILLPGGRKIQQGALALWRISGHRPALALPTSQVLYRSSWGVRNGWSHRSCPRSPSSRRHQPCRAAQALEKPERKEVAKHRALSQKLSREKPLLV